MNTEHNFPTIRPRRLRYNPLVRGLVRETMLTVDDLILPLFVCPGRGVRKEITSMPGNHQLSVDRLVDEVGGAVDLGVRSFIFFGIPTSKDATGSSALIDDGIVQQALRALREAFKDKVLLITDECFCEYTDHGHCGILTDHGGGRLDVDNDQTLPLLAQQCVSHAQAGADLVAPSGMMDGMVRAIRQGLDAAGFGRLPIMSYAAKYASGFYGPFRDAAESPPQFGDRSSYQMDPANGDEALREVALDLAEGADIIMVKPALAYMDIIRRVKERFEVPVAAYNVSGEFAMVKAAAAKGWIDERRVALEILTGIKRAGADMILTYFARDAARWLKQPMHDAYDRSSKWLIQHRGAAILRLAGMTDIESWRPLQAEVVQPRQLPDGLLEVRLAHEPAAHLFIVEIATYPEERLYEQVLRDAMLVYLDRRQLPEVVTLLLRPRRKGGTAGKHNLTSAKAWTRLQCSWRVVKLWTLAAADLLAADDLGLIPWVPLTRFSGGPAAILRQCRERIDAQAPPEERANFLAVAQVLARLRYNDASLLSIFGGRQIMIDSPLIRELLAEEGHVHVLAALKGRFGAVPDDIAERVRAIQDASKLRELTEYAGACKDLNAFRRRLKA